MIDYKKINFWHKVKLNDDKIGIVQPEYTNGIIDIASLRNNYLFDEISFQDKSVLDVGCWDGYFSFESERKGAREVVSLDNPKFRWGGMDGYNFLHENYKSKAEFVEGDVRNLESSLKDKKFDIVLCYGVLYHISDPLIALRNLFKITNEHLIIEGIFSESEEKKLELIECGKLGNDTSNIYSMSIGYIKYISSLYGFKIEKINFQSIIQRAAILLKKEKDFVESYCIH
jgi:tRNA (mo5U34)-methyltransferase